jgi:uncharacterized protein involved in exopolysaccharide biosynthesis
MDTNRNSDEGFKSLPSTVRYLLAIGFRRRKIILRAFLVSLGGALLAVWLFGIQYQSEVEVLIKHDRAEPVVTPDLNPRLASGDSNTTTLAVNTEQLLLQSQDLLTKVVDACPLLVNGHPHFWTPATRAITNRIPGYWEARRGNAIQKLGKALMITPVATSSIIQVAYSSGDPLLSHCVTESLANFYLEKHLEVNRPPTKLFTFFSQQTEQYGKHLQNSELRLLTFARKKQIATAALQRDLAVQQASTFLGNLRTTDAQIALMKERIRRLGDKQSETQRLLTTKETNSDNGALLANLKTELNSLEVQRTDLLTKYVPSYRLVSDVEKQIAQTKSAIAAQEKAQLHSDTTELNPVYSWADMELAKARTELPSLEAEQAATSRNLAEFRREALAMEEGNITEQDLMREVKADEGNYLTYLSKREQARISDMLDERRVVDVAIAEPPTLPLSPMISPLLLVMVSFLLAGFISIGVGLTFDYLDPSFRTPDEVTETLRIPVFASIPVSQPARQVSNNPNGSSNGHNPGGNSRNGHNGGRNGDSKIANVASLSKTAIDDVNEG